MMKLNFSVFFKKIKNSASLADKCILACRLDGV